MRKSAAVLGVIVLAVGAGCSGPTAPTKSPTPGSPSVVVPPAISGVVLEGTRPLAGVTVDTGYGGGVLTDANGAFKLPGGAEGWIRATKPGYAEPCAVRSAGNGPFTVQLVSLAALSGTQLSSPSGFRTVSGVVRQMTGDTLRGIAGAIVDFEPNTTDDWDPAYTFTDVSGRFTLCGLPQNSVLITAVGSTTSYASATVPSDQTFIELDLRP